MNDEVETVAAHHEWEPQICIYHANCDDGFGAALAAKLKWPGIDLVPFNYGWKMFDDTKQLLMGKDILIADFSFPLDEMKRMQAKSIVLLDHHKTAEADLAEVPKIGLVSLYSVPELMLSNESNILAHFDMESSGAMLTWKFAYPEKSIPWMFRMLEDRDLWKFEFKETRPFSLFLRSYPHELNEWREIMECLETPDERIEVMKEAYAIERYYDRRISEIVETATEVKFGKFGDAPVVHCPYAFASDAAHALLEKFPTAPFAAAVVEAYGGKTYSLRSTDERSDVSEIAKAFGGGGHRNAAGFRTPA